MRWLGMRRSAATHARWPLPAPQLPTVSNKVRNSSESIEDYFKDFLKKSPQGKINTEFIDDNGAIQLHSGGWLGAAARLPFMRAVRGAPCPAHATPHAHRHSPTSRPAPPLQASTPSA